MRSILSIIALFSSFALSAQEYVPSEGREQPRSRLISCPTSQEATDAAAGDTGFVTHLTEWSREGNTFAAYFTMPFAWTNRQVLFCLDWASADYEVRINGQRASYNSNGNTPAEFNLTRWSQEGRNKIEVVVSNPSKVAKLESWKNNPAPSIGQSYVMSQPTLRIRDVVTKTWRSSEESAILMAEVAIVVKTESLNPRTSRIHFELVAPTGEVATFGNRDVTLDMRREDTVRFLARIPKNMLWSLENPNRYTLRMRTQHEGRFVEFMETKVGFRTVEMLNGRLRINGVPVTLQAKEVSPQITESEIVKLREQGYNTLRLLPAPVPPALYDICDRVGVFIIPQAPIDTRNSGDSRRVGGNPSNDPQWLGAYIERTTDSYHTSKLHPSVIVFSIATKSANGINLYESYLNMKRLERSRPIIYPDANGEWNSDELIMIDIVW